MKKAKYRGIPCRFDPVTNELEVSNWFFDFLVDINIWWDFDVLGLEELPIILLE